jgi:hypothetical protein
MVFGNTLAVDLLEKQFRNAEQMQSESVTAWSCRLRKLGNQVQEQKPMTPYEEEKLMRYIFWLGLKDENVIKGTRHLYDRRDTYDQLLSATRRVEFEYQQKGLSSKSDESPGAKLGDKVKRSKVTL